MKYKILKTLIKLNDKRKVPIDYDMALYEEIMNINPKLRCESKNKKDFIIWQKVAKKKLKELLNVNLSKSNNFDVTNSFLLNGIRCFAIKFMMLDGVEIKGYLFIHLDNEEHKGIIHIQGTYQNVNDTKIPFNLAQQGYNVIQIQNRGDGVSNSLDSLHINCNAISIGKCYQGVLLEDHYIAVSILSKYSKEIIASGFSLGAEQAMYLSILDDRIKTLISFGWLSTKDSYITGHRPDWCIPNLFTYFDMPDIVAMLSDKNCLFSLGKHENIGHKDSFTTKKALSIVDEVGIYFNWMNGSIRYKEHNGGHEYNEKVVSKYLNDFEILQM